MTAHRMALLNPSITSWSIEANEFPDLSRRYAVSGVPKMVVNETHEFVGGLPESVFVDQVLAAVAAG